MSTLTTLTTPKPPRPMSRVSKMVLAWIKRAGGTVETCGGSGTAACWETPRGVTGWRTMSNQIVVNLESKGLLRFTEYKVGRDGVPRPRKAVLV